MVAVEAVSNGEIVSPSECRPLVVIAVDQVLSILRHVLLSSVEGEQEGLLPLVVDIVNGDCVPLVVAVAADYPSVLGAHES
jgi:hypothetical protein